MLWLKPVLVPWLDTCYEYGFRYVCAVFCPPIAGLIVRQTDKLCPAFGISKSGTWSVYRGGGNPRPSLAGDSTPVNN